ncbi:dipeptidyl aminopeptidase [Pseudoclavibacter sp. RFBG4]|uniref:alpha/beta hydrolase family protein n=1 Tax=Pseudoclavibacter sp. RFBG4 TaxID=2080575 RepID=UPI000CE7486C|nr:alpha/beta hydrolase [Pseudoclavibacter sp. RFBG4]PPG33632.1 dipeptidyl aminopeptidase [Pseudoclavibacter sp. RFBG4]
MSHHPALSRPLFHDADQNFEAKVVLGSVGAGAGDLGEIFATLAAIEDGKRESWIRAWFARAQVTRQLAEVSTGNGRTATAAAQWLRSSAYYGHALNAIAAIGDDDGYTNAFALHRAAWDRFADLRRVPLERLAIRVGKGRLPGYLQRPEVGAEDRASPLLVLVNGSDGTLTDLYATIGASAAARGYAVLYFDGPGQQSQLVAGSHFRPDFEAVLTPVIDTALGIAGVDASRIAVYGVSQAGYWVPRALAFEHRVAAAIVDPGVTDVSTSWLSHLPAPLRHELAKGDAKHFDQYMKLGLGHSPAERAVWSFRAKPYASTGYFAVYREVEKYRLTAELASSITTPLLITAPENEQFWPGQSEELASLVPASELVPFTAVNGADSHCEPLARTAVNEVLLDWLDARLVR